MANFEMTALPEEWPGWTRRSAPQNIPEPPGRLAQVKSEGVEPQGPQNLQDVDSLAPLQLLSLSKYLAAHEAEHGKEVEDAVPKVPRVFSMLPLCDSHAGGKRKQSRSIRAATETETLA